MKNDDYLELVENLVNLGFPDIIEIDLIKQYHFSVLDRFLPVVRRYKTEDNYRVVKVSNRKKLNSSTLMDMDYVTFHMEKNNKCYEISFDTESNVNLRKGILPEKPYYSITMVCEEVNNINKTETLHLSSKVLYNIWQRKPKNYSIPERYLWILERLNLNLESRTYRIEQK